MAAFADCFALAPAASGDGLTATGDWHGEADVMVNACFDGGEQGKAVAIEADVMVNACFDGGEQGKAVAVLAALHDAWPAWRAGLIASLKAEHRQAKDVRIAAVHGYDGDGVEGYFEIEFAAPALFGEDLALAVGTLDGGFEDVGVPG